MQELRVHNFAISVDGYGAGPDQDLDNPLGVGGVALHEWFFPTRTFKAMVGEEGGSTGRRVRLRGLANIGAWIMGPEHVRTDPRTLAVTTIGRAGGETFHRITFRCSS